MAKTLKSLMANKEDKEMLLDPWMEAGTLCMLFAPSGRGKTFLALAIGLCVASAGKLFTWLSHLPRTVLYIDGEMGDELLTRRLVPMMNNLEQDVIQGNAQSLSEDSVKFITANDFEDGVVPNISCPNAQAFYTEEASDRSLIIIDNLDACSDFIGKNDSDVEEWKRIRTWAMELRNSGKTVLFVHHAGKSGAQYGTSKRENAMDTIIRLATCEYPVETPKNSNHFELHFDKGRSMSRKAQEPLFVEQIFNTSAPEYPILSWRYEPLRARRKAVCRAMRMRSGFPKATVGELGRALRVDEATARSIWAECEADAAARNPENKKNSGKREKKSKPAWYKDDIILP